MRSLLWALAATILLAHAPAPSIAQESQDNPAARRAVESKLRSRFTADRAVAVQQLVDFPPADGVKLLVQFGLGDREEEVRRTAYRVLLARKDDREVCDLLLKDLQQDLRGKGSSPAAAVPLLTVLLASELPEVEDDLAKVLGAAMKSKDSLTTVQIAADELAAQATRPALVSLEKLARQKCFAEVFACRRAVVQAMIRIRIPESITALLEIFPKLQGEVRGDLIRHLEQLSGEPHGTDLAGWQAWWKKQGENFEFPKLDGPAAAALPAKPRPGQPSYYGMPLYARRLVFVIDISGSMHGGRLLAAKRELIYALNGLPPEVEVGLVAFHTQVISWKRSLMRLTPLAKQDAVGFVYKLQAGGKTAAYDALEAAFHLEPEAIYFLSDGEPNAGRIPTAPAIITAIGGANRFRRLSIYTIGIACGMAGGADESFMKTLAEQNFGQFRRVDQ
jgi:hypothetical protein